MQEHRKGISLTPGKKKQTKKKKDRMAFWTCPPALIGSKSFSKQKTQNKHFCSSLGLLK